MGWDITLGDAGRNVDYSKTDELLVPWTSQAPRYHEPSTLGEGIGTTTTHCDGSHCYGLHIQELLSLDPQGSFTLMLFVMEWKLALSRSGPKNRFLTSRFL